MARTPCGDVWLSPAVSRVIPTLLRNTPAGGSNRSPFEKLTSRQREVLQLIAEGMTTRQIAERLGLGVKTIETHRVNLMDRLEIHDLAGLVRYAIRIDLVDLGA
jgi:DNA-binding NarL/FixJ family response regulator